MQQHRRPSTSHSKSFNSAINFCWSKLKSTRHLQMFRSSTSYSCKLSAKTLERSFSLIYKRIGQQWTMRMYNNFWTSFNTQSKRRMNSQPLRTLQLEQLTDKQNHTLGTSQNNSTKSWSQNLFNGIGQPNDEYFKNPMHASSSPYHFTTCNSILHSTGPVVIPTCFLTKYSPEISAEQEELMALAIMAMGTAVVSIQEDMPFTGASIAREALEQASGMRIPIKCFGCKGLPK